MHQLVIGLCLRAKKGIKVDTPFVTSSNTEESMTGSLNDDEWLLTLSSAPAPRTELASTGADTSDPVPHIFPDSMLDAS